MTTPDEFTREQVTFRPDGTIVFRFDTADYLIGRPTIRQLRTLLEAERRTSDDYVEQVDALRREVADVDAKDGDAMAQIERRLQMLAVDRASATAAWVYAHVLRPLTEPSFPEVEPDDLPPWVGAPAFVRRLSAHWTSVPLAPGGE